MPPNPDFQGGQQEKFENSARWNITQANKADFELCSNLMLLDTVALTATVFVIASKDALDKVGRGGGIVLIISSIFIVLSIFCGIGNYITIKRFQMGWGTAKSRVANEFANRSNLTIDEMNFILAREQSNRPSRSNNVFFLGQIIFLSLALILYLVIIISVLGSRI